MASEWINARLGEYIDSCLGKMLDKNKNKGELYPYLGNSNVRWGSFDLDDLAHMKFEKHEHERYGIEYGDLIVCEGGEPGRCAIWEDDLPDMKIQKALHRVRTKDGLDSEFLYYWFLHSGRSGLLDAFFTGTTIKHLTGKALKQLPIKIPPLQLQHQVARVLRPLDKKIKLNQQTNQTLEKMAQTLFKSWFVDFDTVVDNALAAGNPIPDELAHRVEVRKKAQALPDFQPLPEHIRKLFPNEFEQTGDPSVGIDGWVPKGWVLARLSDRCELISGKSYKSSELQPSDTALVTLKSFNRGGGYRLDGLKAYSGSYKDSQVVEAGDIVLSCTDVTQAAELVGRPALVASQASYKRLVISLDVIKVKPQSHKYFFYHLLAAKSFTDFALSHCSGTTVLHLKKKAIPSYGFAAPPDVIKDKFCEYVGPFHSKFDLNQQENVALLNTRDYLLPRLISGEVQIDSTSGSNSEIIQEAELQGV
tara:strand:+ start:813 stop:2240 length:1428 start_codon:yes stop_codon:yes gene_type:complete